MTTLEGVGAQASLQVNDHVRLERGDVCGLQRVVCGQEGEISENYDLKEIQISTYKSQDVIRRDCNTYKFKISVCNDCDKILYKGHQFLRR